MKKVCIIGEYSNISKLIKESLSEIGVEVTVISNGDGFKNLKGDIYVGTRIKGLLSLPIIFLKTFYALYNIKKYDVVVYLNPFILLGRFHFYFPKYFLLNKIKRENKKVLLFVAGEDFFVWNYGLDKMPYNHKNSVIRFDYGGKIPYYGLNEAKKWNLILADKVNSIFSFSYLYYKSYEKDFHFKLQNLFVPIKCNPIPYAENNKLKVLHGINRIGAKGSDIILQAIENIKDKCSNLEFIIVERLPFHEYKKVYADCDVIIDQVYSTYIGINGLQALSSGKILLSGAEQVALDFLNIEKCPILNISPNICSIEKQLLYINSLTKKQILELKQASLTFIEEYHSTKSFNKSFLEYLGFENN